MTCAKCGSTQVHVSTTNIIEEKRKRGIVYWLLLWWLELLLWIGLFWLKLFHTLFGKHTKLVSKTLTYATCQNCGHHWTV